MESVIITGANSGIGKETAKQLGCHIITIPPSIIQKIENFGKSFDQLTNETVKGFLADSQRSKFKI